MAGNTKHPGRSVISKVSAILRAIGEGHGRSLTEIAAASDLPLSTVHRLAGELAGWGLLQRDGTGAFRPGLPLTTLAANVSFPTVLNSGELRGHLAPVMDDLFRETGAQVRAGWLDGTHVAFIEKVSAHEAVSQPSPWTRLPAHATALGKSLLAFSPAIVVDCVTSAGLKQYTRTTIATAESLRRTLPRIRETRFATSDRELDDRWCGIAAPVIGPGGTAVAAIELRVDSTREDLPRLRGPLAVATACLSRHLTVQRPAPTPAGRPGLLTIPSDRSARREPVAGLHAGCEPA